MCHVDVIRDVSECSGMRLRATKSGPELKMLDDFSDILMDRYRSQGGRVKYLMVFEPCIDSGYPDLVVMRYTETFMNAWQDARTQLNDIDLRLLTYLMTRPSSCELACRRLGMASKDATHAFDKLEEAGVAEKRDNTWYSIGKRRIYGLKAIETYEAKTQSIRKVHRQALANTRFSTKSVAVVSTRNPTRRTLSLFADTGVGLYGSKGLSTLIEPARHSMPNCYVALKFNEWLGRCLMGGALA